MFFYTITKICFKRVRKIIDIIYKKTLFGFEKIKEPDKKVYLVA